MSIVVFDSETTGLAAFKQPPGHESQPHIVQLGAILYDDNGRVMAEMNLLVKPDGWTVPKEASDIHGITTEMCERYGLPLKTVIMLFIVLARRAKRTVAHNRSYDHLMVETALIRLGFTKELEEWRAMSASGGFCTMQAMTPVCKLPGRRGSFKWPTLMEAHVYLFKEEFGGSHDAMNDVRACARVYHEIQRREVALALAQAPAEQKEAA